VIAAHRCKATVVRYRGQLRLSFTSLGLCVLTISPILASPIAAQAITGMVVEVGTETPIQGVSVTLIDRAGERLAWRMTNGAGRFDFRMPQAGTYWLQAERIGHARVLSEPIPIDRGVTVVYRMEAPIEAIMLEGISVASSRRCEVRPGQGEATATVWEEARKALEATSRTGGQGVYRYLIRRYERELDAQGRDVMSEESRLQTQTLVSPFASVNVDDLLENGFVRDDDDGSSYFAPDADVLLSDAFLDTHCMSLTEGRAEAEGLLGLSFEPTHDRGVPEISGVLWLDPDDAELQWLDYGYEFLDVPNSDRLGGRVRFHGLPNGTWFVREWYIRMALLGATVEDGRRAPVRLIGIREEGGQVVRINNLRGDLLLDSGAGILEGVVLDSAGTQPVVDVVVLMDDSARATTDEDGRFRFTGLVEGYYGVRVLNPVLDSLGFSPEPLFSVVKSGDVASVRLPYPSLDEVMTRACDARNSSDHKGILTGFAKSATGDPVTGAQLSVRWREIVDVAGRRADRVGYAYNIVDGREDGFFLICGVPRDRRIDIMWASNGDESRLDRIDLSQDATVLRRDFVIPRAR